MTVVLLLLVLVLLSLYESPAGEDGGIGVQLGKAVLHDGHGKHVSCVGKGKRKPDTRVQSYSRHCVPDTGRPVLVP